MGNLGNSQSIASCHFTNYGPSCKSCWYNIKVFSENMDHPEPIKIVTIKKCPKLLRIYDSWIFKKLEAISESLAPVLNPFKLVELSWLSGRIILTTYLNPLMLKAAKSSWQFWWNLLIKIKIVKIFEREMFIRTSSTTFPQIFFKIILDSKVIIKSTEDPDDNFWRNSLSVNGLKRLAGQHWSLIVMTPSDLWTLLVFKTKLENNRRDYWRSIISL